MNLSKEEYKKLVKEIKEDIKTGAEEGEYSQRIRLLTYGFVRGVPYRVIEERINEDKFEPIGQSSFRSTLNYSVFSYLKKKKEVLVTEELELRTEIKDWLMRHLKQEEVAA